MIFKKDYRDWTKIRDELNPVEIDGYHPPCGIDHDGMAYHERMEDVYKGAIQIIMKAYSDGKPWVMFRHGWSTSRPGNTTFRSQIRKAMRSAEATPYIIRKKCIQHESVFVAAIRPL